MGNAEILFRSGEFVFRFIHDWGRMPEELAGAVVRGIIQGKDGLFYAAVQAESYPIAVFDQNGAFVRGLCHDLELKHVHGLYADADATLYFCDDLDNTIYHIDTEGRVLERMGDPAHFSDSGVDPTLPLLESLHSIARAAGPFNRPTRLIKAKNGDRFVSDGYGNAAVHHFDAAGRLLHTWGGPGDAPGCFCLPHSLWEDASGRIWVVDRENNRVQVFQPDGRLITVLDGLHTPTDIWGDETHLYVSENRAGLAIFDMNLHPVARLGYPTTAFNGCPIGSHSLCGDNKGNLYLGEIKAENPLMKLERL